ncbi:Retinal-binding protein, partial [Armadillidium vulgare]
ATETFAVAPVSILTENYSTFIIILSFDKIIIGILRNQKVVKKLKILHKFLSLLVKYTEGLVYIITSLNMDSLTQKEKDILNESLEWRKEWGIDNIVEWSPPEVLKKFFPGGISGYDKEGAPVVLIPYGNIDLRGLIRSSSSEDLIKYFTQLFEKSLKLLREQSRDGDQPIRKEIFIVDFEHFSLRDFTW